MPTSTNKIPNLRHLRAFVVLAEHLHFNRAARALDVSQSVLSSQIKSLEQQLELELFKRDTRTVTITKAGRLLLPEAKRCLNQANRFVLARDRISLGGVGHISIGYVGSVLPSGVVTRNIAEFRMQADCVSFEIEEIGYDSQIREIRTQNLDLGFMRSPIDNYDNELALLPLFEEDVCIAIRKDHRLASQKTISLSSLRDELFITNTMTTVAGLQGQFLEACSKHSFTPKMMHRGATFGAILALVDAGFGIAIAPSSASKLGFSNLAYIKTSSISRSVVCAVYNRANESTALKNFLDFLRSKTATKTPGPNE